MTTLPDTLDRPLGGVVGLGTEGDPRLIVELWLPVRIGGGWRLLMCRRVPARGGFWQGVSGRVETSDATLRAAALRELHEELGLDGSRVETIVDLEQTYDFISFDGERHYRKCCFAVVLANDTTTSAVTLSDEHDECRLMTFEEAIDSARFPEYVEELTSLESMLHA
ncbi:MAG: NUDIX domain-containing protein [Planctomycetota bacterium]|nr:NUDIX domain-containing protein [Planctomycetota bacterium]